jgi:hypothetical protein
LAGSWRFGDQFVGQSPSGFYGLPDAPLSSVAAAFSRSDPQFGILGFEHNHLTMFIITMFLIDKP